MDPAPRQRRAGQPRAGRAAALALRAARALLPAPDALAGRGGPAALRQERQALPLLCPPLAAQPAPAPLSRRRGARAPDLPQGRAQANEEGPRPARVPAPLLPGLALAQRAHGEGARLRRARARERGDQRRLLPLVAGRARAGRPRGPGVIERRHAQSLSELRAAYNETYARAEYGEKEALYELVWELLRPAPGAAVLDVGCGAGPFEAYAQARGLRTLALDLSDEALKKAAARGRGPLLLAQGERLPLADASFERVVCLGNLEHFLDPAAA
ncbi:MAG TPA: hypothetical protein DEA08_37790, partial [Planctomycetes bacterium]|nr:hypothetical protein [Planctomycetota bacterium]